MGRSQTARVTPRAGGSSTMEAPYRATRNCSICWSVHPSATRWATVARTATAVEALDWATDRSSQLGQRITDSMAEARWDAVGGDPESAPLPTISAPTRTTPNRVQKATPSVSCENPHRSDPHAWVALACAITWSRSAAVTGATM